MYESLENFPLRKINFVKTRTTILKAVSNLLKEKNFSDITVDEICQRAQISRGTFFNYFSTKEYVFHYYLRIFTVRIALRIEQWDKNLSFEQKIKEMYEWLNEETQYSKFVDNYITFLLNVGEEKNEMKLTDAEFVYFFNDINESEYSHYNSLTLQTLFENIVEAAKLKGEITIEKSKTEYGNLMSGVLVASYVTDHFDSSADHLEVFNKIWN
ncbi:TetR family transcriptional regulator [Candidatus Epulonipiscium fishelsonii]|uniref:TetR family transcriptional regulator n=1 Tax=Candidatus Epulonipiscium fishelsonii TaxID=77094 RepID=A0ACC8X9L7_9FIRM|nr:TetR family transcriptional regulator [Epulopiscium sp. SCG-D08WGA-EpuloA1]